MEQVNVCGIVLVYVARILRQSILFKKNGNGAVIKHVVGSTGKTIEFFSIGISGIRKGAGSRRIRKL